MAELETRRGLLQLAAVASAALAAAACEPARAPAPVTTKPRPIGPPATVPPTTATPTTTSTTSTTTTTTIPPVVVPPTLPPNQVGYADPAALHAARRLSWGATPTLAAHINQIGLSAYLEEQLDWESLDDSFTDAMVAPWPRPTWDAAAIRDNEPWRVPVEMAATESVRRVFSPRQVHELLVEFWHDHFNIDANHVPAQFVFPNYDRTVIRPNALGKFADMLVAVARHAAMSLYLDQANSRADGGRVPNENFARELMELHTVGTGAGYSQDDVVAVAHLLTGWSVDEQTGDFLFRSTWHNPGPMTPERVVLGWSRGSLSGEAAGLAFIDHLAHLPMTATRICHKLAVRLIGEHVQSADSVVSAAAAAFSASDTDISDAIRILVLSQEFADSTNAKVRRPSELSTQMSRSLGVGWAPENPDSFLWSVWSNMSLMGHAPHSWPTPDGYPDENAHWLSVGSLVVRWNLAVAFTYGSVEGMHFEARDTMEWAENDMWGEWLDAIARNIVGEPWSPEVRQLILDEYEVTETTVFRNWDHWAASPIVALLLQTPEFQRR